MPPIRHPSIRLAGSCFMAGHLRYIAETMRSKRDGLPDVAVWALFGPDGRAQACPFGRAKADIAQDCGEV